MERNAITSTAYDNVFIVVIIIMVCRCNVSERMYGEVGLLSDVIICIKLHEDKILFYDMASTLTTTDLRLTLTAHTGSRVSPTRNVISHLKKMKDIKMCTNASSSKNDSYSSGIDAKNFKSSAKPVLFSNIVKSGSSAAIGPSLVSTSGIFATTFNILRRKNCKIKTVKNVA
jgi:hypothetical protein